MKPKRILLIRHLQSEANVDFTIYSQKPDCHVELTPHGHQQAIEVGRKISEMLGENRTIQFYFSPYTRARQTLQGILLGLSNIRYRVLEEPRLREQEAGMLQTVEERSEYQKHFEEYGRFFFRFPQGESAADVYDRISSFLGSLWRHFSEPDYPETVVIVSHGRTLRSFLMRWFRFDHLAFEKLNGFDNGIIIPLVLNPKTDLYELPPEICRRIHLDPEAIQQNQWREK